MLTLRKAALSSHPDKVPHSERPAAEIRFKSVSQAYDILSDEDKRELYDRHGMAAFDKSQAGPGGMGGGMDFEDLFAQMFMGGGGMPGGGMPGMPGGARRGPVKGEDEVQEYEVTLEELFKGKTTRFSSTKNIVCTTCSGSGGKDKAKSQPCAACSGRGRVMGLQQVGPGLVTQVNRECGSCSGAGQVFKDKDKCKRCKGKRIVETKKLLELYIPRGSREGEKIVLQGEADQAPGQEPGDIIFVLKETPHETFKRAGADLVADVKITLAEALTGFHRVVLTHLDGRGIQLNIKQPKGKILRPGQILKVRGEGMPLKRSDARGDLYLAVDIDFPEDGWLKDEATIKKIRDVLPKSGAAIKHGNEVDDVEVDFDADLDDFGAGSGDPRAGAEWEDEDDEDMDGQPQCAQQ